MRAELEIPFGIKEIYEITGAVFSDATEPSITINAITTDTRECKENDLFIALNGENESGEKYVREALKKGCHVLSSSHQGGAISVNDTVEGLLKLAKAYKAKVAPRYTVAVTGSVGKSTTVKFISTILKEQFKVHSTIGNFNNHIGVPLTLLSMPKDTEVLVTELGMNHLGEISRLSHTVNPDIGVITGIGTAHIGNLGSRKKIAEAKLEIRDGMNSNDLLLPASEPLVSNIPLALYVGRNSSLSSFTLNDTDTDTYSFVSKARTINDIVFFDKREHLLSDLAMAISVADMLEMSEKDILSGIHAITHSDLRQRFIELPCFTVFDDSYTASLESIEADLKYISSLGRPTGAFLGDILELGDDAEPIHRQIGEIAAKLRIDHLYLYGEYSKYVYEGALEGGMDENNIFINCDISSPRISIDHIRNNHTIGEIVLFKASHRLRLDKIADIMKNEERISNDKH